MTASDVVDALEIDEEPENVSTRMGASTVYFGGDRTLNVIKGKSGAFYFVYEAAGETIFSIDVTSSSDFDPATLSEFINDQI